MKFTLFSVDAGSDFTKTKHLIKFLSDDELSIFHYVDFNEYLTHVVFHLKDEYLFGTKKSGNQVHMPVNQYINAFFDKRSNLVFLELINEKYCDEVLKFLGVEGIKLHKYTITNNLIIGVLEKLKGFVKSVDVTDENDEEVSYESVKKETLQEIIDKECQINHILMLCGSYFVSMTNTGIVSINNNDLDTLTELVGAFT
ncbi:hypothetical protein [Paenibacillus macerans]|uniref:hypothetical protein n=1 Tax=Paenibacillus macerans TaxID=44252 RepID=UPI0022E9534E|nr:hypothetical protein [Paenibacillus macerans]